MAVHSGAAGATRQRKAKAITRSSSASKERPRRSLVAANNTPTDTTLTIFGVSPLMAIPECLRPASEDEMDGRLPAELNALSSLVLNLDAFQHAILEARSNRRLADDSRRKIELFDVQRAKRKLTKNGGLVRCSDQKATQHSLNGLANNAHLASSISNTSSHATYDDAIHQGSNHQRITSIPSSDAPQMTTEDEVADFLPPEEYFQDSSEEYVPDSEVDSDNEIKPDNGAEKDDRSTLPITKPQRKRIRPVAESSDDASCTTRNRPVRNKANHNRPRKSTKLTENTSDGERTLVEVTPPSRGRKIGIAARKKPRAQLQPGEKRAPDHWEYCFKKPDGWHVKSLDPNTMEIEDLRRVDDLAGLIYPIEVPWRKGERKEICNAEEMQEFLNSRALRPRRDSASEQTVSQERKLLPTPESPNTNPDTTEFASSRDVSMSDSSATTPVVQTGEVLGLGDGEPSLENLCATLGQVTAKVISNLAATDSGAPNRYDEPNAFLIDTLNDAVSTTIAVLSTSDERTQDRLRDTFMTLMDAAVANHRGRHAEKSSTAENDVIGTPTGEPVKNMEVGCGFPSNEPITPDRTDVPEPPRTSRASTDKGNDTGNDNQVCAISPREATTVSPKLSLPSFADLTDITPVCVFCNNRPRRLRMLSCNPDHWTCVSCYEEAVSIPRRPGVWFTCPACVDLYESGDVYELSHCTI